MFDVVSTSTAITSYSSSFTVMFVKKKGGNGHCKMVKNHAIIFVSTYKLRISVYLR